MAQRRFSVLEYDLEIGRFYQRQHAELMAQVLSDRQMTQTEVVFARDNRVLSRYIDGVVEPEFANSSYVIGGTK